MASYLACCDESERVGILAVCRWMRPADRNSNAAEVTSQPRMTRQKLCLFAADAASPEMRNRIKGKARGTSRAIESRSGFEAVDCAYALAAVPYRRRGRSLTPSAPSTPSKSMCELPQGEQRRLPWAERDNAISRRGRARRHCRHRHGHRRDHPLLLSHSSPAD